MWFSRSNKEIHVALATQPTQASPTERLFFWTSDVIMERLSRLHRKMKLRWNRQLTETVTNIYMEHHVYICVMCLK